MTWNRPTFDQWLTQARADINTSLGNTRASVRRTFENATANAIAGASHLLSGHIQFLIKMAFVLTARGRFLDLHGERVNIRRILAQPSSGTVTFTGTDSTLIDAGTSLTSESGLEYITLESGTISGGSASILVGSVIAGVATIVDAGAELTLSESIVGVDDTATVDADGLIGGLEQEEDEAYLPRILARIRFPPQGGAPGDYVAWALEVPGITRAWERAQQMGPGTVVVYAVKSSGALTGVAETFDYEDFTPATLEILIVQNYLQERDPDTPTNILGGKAPVHARVFADTPTITPQNFTITLYPNTSANQALIEEAISDAIDETTEPSGTIRLGLLYSAASSVLPDDGYITITSPSADYSTGAGEISSLGTITWNDP